MSRGYDEFYANMIFYQSGNQSDAAGKPVKWKVENSWGADNGFGGCFIMTNDWFNEYMFRLVVNKKYASEQLLKEFDQKPTMLTPDDPLFQLED